MSNEPRANIKGYHVNDERRCLKFLQDKDYLIISKDKFWLGLGMYFWDSTNNADYWMGEKIRKKPDEKYIKVSANIYIDEEILLDLSDGIVEDRLECLWKMYCSSKKEDEDQPLGIKINKLIDFYDMLKDIKVVKGIGDYDSSKDKEERFIDSGEKCKPRIKGNQKTIYCVRDPLIAVNRNP